MSPAPERPGAPSPPAPAAADPLTGWRLGFLCYWIASTVVGVWIVARGLQVVPVAGAEGAGRGWYLLRLGLTALATLLAGGGVWHLLRPSAAMRPYWDRALPGITGLRVGLLLIGMVEWLSPARPGHSTQSAGSILAYALLTVGVTVGWLLWWRRTRWF